MNFKYQQGQWIWVLTDSDGNVSVNTSSQRLALVVATREQFNSVFGINSAFDYLIWSNEIKNVWSHKKFAAKDWELLNPYYLETGGFRLIIEAEISKESTCKTYPAPLLKNSSQPDKKFKKFDWVKIDELNAGVGTGWVVGHEDSKHVLVKITEPNNLGAWPYSSVTNDLGKRIKNRLENISTKEIETFNFRILPTKYLTKIDKPKCSICKD